MTENNAAAPGTEAPQQPVMPRMNVMAQFVRDLSFENVLAQKGATGEVQPEIAVQVNIEPRKRNVEGQFEVIFKLQVSSNSKGSDTKLFILELDYVGLFQIDNVPQEQLHPYLMIECPRMLFPFVRRIVHDVTRDGGFPAVNLETIDFMALYRQEIVRRAEEMKAQQADA